MYAATLSSATAHAVPAPCGRALPSRAPQPQPPPGRRRQLQRASVLRCQASPPTPPAKLSPRERKLAQKKALRQQERAGRQADAVVVNQEEQPPGPASGPEPTRPQERNAPQPATVEPPRAQQQRDGGAAATTSAPAPPPPASRPAAASKTPPPPHPATAAGSRRGDSSGAPAPAPQAAAAAAAPAQLLSQLMALAEEKLGVRDCAASASAAAADSVDAVARAVVAQAQAGALSEQQVSDAAWALLALGHPLARAAQDALGAGGCKLKLSRRSLIMGWATGGVSNSQTRSTRSFCRPLPAVARRCAFRGPSGRPLRPQSDSGGARKPHWERPDPQKSAHSSLLWSRQSLFTDNRVLALMS